MEGFVDINDYSYHYRIIGTIDKKQPFIIFLHEGLGSIPQWRDFPGQLCKATGMPGLLYERHGYGRSSPPWKYRSEDFLHREAFTILPALLEKLNLTAPHFVFGHSDGATIALLYASQKPENLKALVAVAPHVFLEEQSVRGIARTKEAYLKGTLKKGLDKYHAPHTDNVVLSWTNYWLDPANRGWDMRPLLKNITVPVLFIQGEKDMFGTLQQGREIQRRVNSRFESLIIEDGGHTPHFQNQDRVISATYAFFQK